MPTPTLVTITGDLAPVLLAKEVHFKVPTLIRYNAGPDVILPSTIPAEVAPDGTFTVDVYGTNDPAWSPSNWTYTVVVIGDNLREEFETSVPYDAGTMDFSDLLPAESASLGTLYAAFNHTHEGGGGGGGALPAGTVSSATSFGGASTAGAASTYSRGDHNHGTPAAPTPASIGAATSGHNHTGTYDPVGTATTAVANHAAAGDPHPGYLTQAEGNAAYDASGTATAAVAAHEGAVNPHPTYLTQAEGDAAYSALGHTHVAANVTDLTEVVQDTVGAMVVAGANVTATYNDGAGTLTIASSGGGGGASTVVKRAIVSSGNITPQNSGGAWQELTGGPRLVIPAAVGDYISVDIASLLITKVTTTFYDFAVLNGASLVRFGSSGTGTPATEGDGSLYHDTVFPRVGTIFEFVAEAGDINAGNITICVAVNSVSAAGAFHAGFYPFRWRVMNYGAISVS